MHLKGFFTYLSYNTTNRKTLKIYNILATIIIGVLAISIISLLKNLEETEVLLEECADRYYKEIGK